MLTTGYSPYLLFFGREARLPIDTFLTPTADRVTTIDEWVEVHQHRLRESMRRANAKPNKKANQRKQRHDKGANADQLKAETRVLVKKRVPGRNEIQDTYEETPYKVIGHQSANSSSHVIQ